MNNGIIERYISQYADIEIIEPQPDLPDMVFTANAGVVSGNKAIASHFMPHERRPEESHFKSWFRKNGYDLLDLMKKLDLKEAETVFLIEVVPGYGQGMVLERR